MNLANTGGGIYTQWFCSATHNLGQYQPHRNGGFVQPFCYMFWILQLRNVWGPTFLVVAWNPYWQWPLTFENYFLSFWSWNTSKIATLVHVAAFHEAEVFALVVWTKKHFTKQKRNVAVGVHWKDQGPISWNPGRLMDSQKNNKIYVKGIPRIPRLLGLVYLHAFRWLCKVHVSKYLHNITIQMFFCRANKEFQNSR